GVNLIRSPITADPVDARKNDLTNDLKVLVVLRSIDHAEAFGNEATAPASTCLRRKPLAIWFFAHQFFPKLWKKRERADACTIRSNRTMEREMASQVGLGRECDIKMGGRRRRRKNAWRRRGMTTG